jgi:hypothetical protein
MISLTKNLKVQVIQKVKIKDNNWNRPGGGYLNPGTTVQVTSGPTRISDVPFKVLEGSGEITHRGLDADVTKEIKNGSTGFFFSQGHNTTSPYDYGTLDTQYFKEI